MRDDADTDSTGIRIQLNSHFGVKVAWDEVAFIKLFKRDLVTTDLVCIEIGFAEMAIEINEEEAGFDRLAAAIQERFPKSKAQFSQVLFPAFAVSEQEIYRKPHDDDRENPQ